MTSRADLDGTQVYSMEQIREFVSRYLAGEDREKLDPILDACVVVYETGTWTKIGKFSSSARPKCS